MNKKLLGSSLVTFAALGAFLWQAGGNAQATRPAGAVLYQVKVTNLTPNQIMSPILAASHNRNVALFKLGEAASPELATLAEAGDNAELKMLLESNSDVGDVVSGAGVLMPGASETLVIEASSDTPLLSLAGMLVSTNDTFMAVSDFVLPLTRVAKATGVAYDAGSEYNSEECPFIPGPPCGGMAHDPRPPEGFVHVSSGVHGIADLAEEQADWRNPVAAISVLRLN